MLSAEGEGLEYVRTTPDAAVDGDLDATPSYWRAFAKSVKCRGSAIKLTTPVVRDNDAVDIVVYCKLDVRRRQN
jgi:hypothetical protein